MTLAPIARIHIACANSSNSSIVPRVIQRISPTPGLKWGRDSFPSKTVPLGNAVKDFRKGKHRENVNCHLRLKPDWADTAFAGAIRPRSCPRVTKTPEGLEGLEGPTQQCPSPVFLSAAPGLFAW